MGLAIGHRIGPYDITGTLGAGGMGEVYRARDTKLGRDVALKILPDTFALDPDRLARFHREAQVLASLNHPHIGAIYGLEDSGGTHALVLELVEGDTLADRIAHGPIPWEEAFSIARQICEALEAAHEQGIIHRDLKPANIKVRPDGTVKVLDFGLAKIVDEVGRVPVTRHPGPAGSKEQDPAHELSQALTMTSPAMMTQAGMILGTAAYMSPEQAKGREADKRSDLWAFGCVLYEMLTGRGPFAGDDMGDTLANVLKREPDFSLLPAGMPLPVRTLLQRCLVKDRRKRIADIAAALFVLDHQAGDAATSTVSAAPPVRGPLWRRVAVLTGGALVVAAITGTVVWSLTRTAPLSVVRTTITTSGSTALTLEGTDRDVAITPDGSRIVYRGNSQLLLRSLTQLEPTVLSVGPGPGPRNPFISPDGQWVGFFNGNSMRKVAITGGPPVTVCDGQAPPRGATWGPDGTIIFATQGQATGLLRVSAAGGEPILLTKPDPEREADHSWPEFLPGGEAVLFTIIPANGSTDDAQIAVLDLQTGTSKVLIRGGSHAHYVPTGHLVYGVTGTLRAVAFDLGRMEVVGTPVPVLDGVVTTNFGAADVAVAANGSLVYVPGVAGGGGRQTVVSVDRQGRASPLPGLPPDAYRDVRVSPDGERLALATQTDVWIYDFARATLSRLTTHPASDTQPLWTPDGQRIIFTSNRAGYPELFWRPADGTGRDEPLLGRAKDLFDLRANGWSADGSQLLVSEVSLGNESAIVQIAIERPAEANVLLKGDARNDFAAVSPDGQWMAYRSSVPGQAGVYVERYPELGNRQLISTGVSGRMPIWSRDGRELFFGTLDGRQMSAVAVKAGTTLVAGPPQVLFEFDMFVAVGGRPYDIVPDGRFIIIRSGQAEAGGGTAPNLIVVQNWFEELKRLVPTP